MHEIELREARDTLEVPVVAYHCHHCARCGGSRRCGTSPYHELLEDLVRPKRAPVRCLRGTGDTGGPSSRAGAHTAAQVMFLNRWPDDLGLRPAAA